MATLQQLERALFNADKAGDMEAARKLAIVVKRERANAAANSEIPTTPDALAPEAMTQEIQQPTPAPTLGEKVIGAGEAALATGTGMTTGALGMIGGTLKGLAEQLLSGNFSTDSAKQAVAMAAVEQSASKGAEALTYAPRTPSGQAQTEAAGEAMAPLAAVAPLAELQTLGTAAKLAGAPARVAAEGVASAAKQAGIEGVQTIKEKLPAVREAVGAPARDAGAAQTPAELQRITTAESLPVPIELTKGAAAREAEQLAFEKEQMKGPHGAPLRARAEENNLQALGNMDALFDMSEARAPDLAASGNAVTKALSEGYKQAKNRTRAAYAKARQSPGAQELVDTARTVSIGEGDMALDASIFGYINDQPRGLANSAVPDAARQAAVRLGIAELDDSGNLVPREATVAQLEGFRQEINDAVGFDPRDVRQGTIIKKLIDETVGDTGGPEYLKARAIRRQQARKYENRAVVARLVSNVRGMDDPKVYADQVLRRSILNAAPEEITFLKRVLKTTGEDGRQAWKELEGATIRHMQDEATKGMGRDSAGNAIVSPAQLNKMVNELDRNGRLDVIFGKQRAEIIRDLNDVVKDVNTVPPGTLVNTSGTAGALMAAMAEAGAAGALTGLPVPVLSLTKLAVKGVKDAKLRARIEKSLSAKQ